jgi:hypothetical protein
MPQLEIRPLAHENHTRHTNTGHGRAVPLDSDHRQWRSPPAIVHFISLPLLRSEHRDKNIVGRLPTNMRRAESYGGGTRCTFLGRACILAVAGRHLIMNAMSDSYQSFTQRSAAKWLFTLYYSLTELF